jgi:hypothetical protein
VIERIRPLPTGPPAVGPVERVRRRPREERDRDDREAPTPGDRPRPDKPEEGHVDVRA